MNAVEHVDALMPAPEQRLNLTIQLVCLRLQQEETEISEITKKSGTESNYYIGFTVNSMQISQIEVLIDHKLIFLQPQSDHGVLISYSLGGTTDPCV